jgi:hypothetical protein
VSSLTFKATTWSHLPSDALSANYNADAPNLSLPDAEATGKDQRHDGEEKKKKRFQESGRHHTLYEGEDSRVLSGDFLAQEYRR